MTPIPPRRIALPAINALNRAITGVFLALLRHINQPILVSSVIADKQTRTSGRHPGVNTGESARGGIVRGRRPTACRQSP